MPFHLNVLLASILIIFGSAYALIVPPFESPDEVAHFARAHGLSEGQLILKDHPRSLIQFLRDEIRRQRGDNNLIVKTYTDMLAQPKPRYPTIAVNTALYCPLSYSLYAAVIKCIAVAGNSRLVFIIAFYLFRLISVALYVFLTCVAVRYCRYGRWIIWLVALTPMAVFLAAVISVDSLVLLAAVLCVAAAFGYPSLRAYGWMMFGAATILAATKPPYLVLLLAGGLVLPCLPAVDRSWRAIIWLASMAWAVCLAGCWNLIAKDNGAYDAFFQMIASVTQLDFDMQLQLGILLQSPLRFLHAIWILLVNNSTELYCQIVGVFGWADIALPEFIVPLWAVAALAAVMVSPRFCCGSANQAVFIGIGMICLAMVTFMAVAASAFLLWTPVGASVINIQGRYLLPILPAALIGLSTFHRLHVSGPVRIFVNGLIIMILVVLNVVSIFIIFARYA